MHDEIIFMVFLLSRNHFYGFRTEIDELVIYTKEHLIEDFH